MGLTHLLEALERDARIEIDRIGAAARAAADAIAAESAARLAERRRLALEECERRHRHELEQALAVARRTARRTVLDARQRLVQRVFAAARAELAQALDLATYRNGLPAALEQARAALGPGPVVLNCTPGLRAAIDELDRLPDATVVSDDSMGNGFVLRVADGSVEVVDTLEERLERRRPELTRWMFERLEGGG